MKNQLILFSLSLSLISSAHASIKHSKYKADVNEVAFTQGNSLKHATIMAAMKANKLADVAKMESVIATIERTTLQKQEEVVTNTGGMGFNFKILFGLLGGSGSMNYDSAKILTTNPKDVAAFTKLKEKDFKRIQVSLRKHIEKNETEIFYSKVFAAKAIKLASQLSMQELMEVYPLVTKTAQRVSNVSFLGYQKITSCVQVNYAERSRDWGVALTGLISASFQDWEKQKAYSETSCSVESIPLSVSELALNSVDLMLADELIKESDKHLQLKIVNEAEAPAYPSWDSPYLD